MKLELEQVPKYSESQEHLSRQQNIDALLVLAKIAEMQTTNVIQEKVHIKISQLLDKI